MIETPSDLISIHEACRRLGVSRPTLAGMVADGKLRRVQLSKKAFRVARRDVEAIIGQAFVPTAK